MKHYKFYFILVLLSCSLTNGQKLLERKFTKVDNKIIPQKLSEIHLKKTLDKSKKTNCLSYNCSGNLKISYCNYKTEDNYVEYQELGTFDHSKIIVVEKMTYNEESYILINQKLCTQITLHGFLLKIEKSNKYVTYNNPSTDKPYIIQIINIISGITTIQDEIILPEYIKLKRLYSLKSNEAYILDVKDKLWKTTIRN